MNKNIKYLMDTVIENDYCIGCGACASVDDSPFEMRLDKNGKFRPVIKYELDCRTEPDVNSVCPFSNESKNETELGKELFKTHHPTFNENTGYYLKNFAGYVKEGKYRDKGSSGGMGSWIASQLLKLDLVDGIIHVKEKNDNSNLLFEYQVSSTLDELSSGAKSKYYPIELSKVMKFVKEKKGRYAIIGIPCFIKSVRLLAENDKVIKERIKYCIGLVCGHLKSDMFAKSMGWQLGIEPDNLSWIDFRVKLEDKAANDYGVEVEGTINGEKVKLSAPRKELYTTNWGQGLFKYNACEFCDDVLAETADVTVGDAWLPEYANDSDGTNVITVRNPDILQILEEGISAGKVYLDELTAERVYKSQAGGFRHRRDGLSYRLHLKDENNEWRPNKRVRASDKIDSNRKQVYKKRMQLSQESFNAFKIAEENQHFDSFIDYMNPNVEAYNKTINPPLIKRIVNKIKREIKKVI
ncbi:Coenzyme F420 hydrogenase/dehydrogenase, beta subunit C-terminal domain [Pseudogracilibacillus sp. SE30717A]|uniref:Coenzyme F420 hydrogenase/dehydrogenase, beta subunit C-terminal domain n=1 Tax=Pseudogracilibacillus sp. SE30717A TaxID=3098293 RepID=UPI00300E13BC